MKKVVALLLGVVMTASMLAGCGSTPAKEEAAETPKTEDTAEVANVGDTDTTAENTDGKKFKVGITIQSLANSYWAGVFGDVDKLMKEKGWEFTIMDCKDNSAEQISQIENFTSSGCDLIMVHPSDPNAIEDACAAAREEGIKVMSWDDKMTNTDLNWVLDNAELGKAIGKETAKFINEKYTADKKAEIAIMDYPQTPILLDRENGILEGLKDAEGKYEIIAQQPALEAGAAQSNMETILQANPDCKIVCSIGSGGDIGANEAFMVSTNGDIPDDMGIFSADGTEQQLQAIVAGQASRVSVAFEGSNKRTAVAVVDLYEKLMQGETFAEQDLVRPLTAIDINNAPEYLADYK